MNLSLSDLWNKFKNQLRNNNSPKTLAEYNREVLVKQGADQFKKLLDKGLSIPVAHL